jgi:hypothetical protein
VGYEQINKGLETWWRLCAHEPVCSHFDLYHLGAAGKKLPNVTYVSVSFQDEGPDAMVDALIRHGIDVVVLWSIWPETYSFTFFEALAAGCFVVTNRHSGNIQAQVRHWHCGRVFDNESDLVSFLSDNRRVRAELERTHRHRGGRFRLRFNPRLAESVEDLRTAAPVSASQSDNSIHRRSEWLNQLFVLVSTRTASDRMMRTELQRRRDEIDRLRAHLAVFRMSRLHQLVERFRHWLKRHRRFSSRVRPLFFRLSQPLINLLR